MPCIRSCIVVGGGIGGLATARALAARGIEVQVVERAKSFSPTAGAGFGFSPNGQACLASIGIEKQALLDMGHGLETHSFVKPETGELICQANSLLRIKQRFGLGLLGTLRADLVNVLAAPLLAAKRLHYGRQVVKVDHSDDEAVVHFEDGSSTSADLVVGADGINSLVLNQVFSSNARPPIYAGENIIYGVIEDAVGPNASRQFDHAILGKEHRLVQGFSTLGEFISFPVGNTGTLVWAQTYRGTPVNAAEWDSCDSPLQNIARFLSAKAVPESALIRDLVAKTEEDRILHFPLMYREHQKEWFRGRVCLLGDSCHATLPYAGQGANQAIEDSVVLAEMLTTHKSLPLALQAYYDIRAPRTRRIVNMAYWMGKLLHPRVELQAAVTRGLMKRMLESGVFFRVAAEEITKHSPVEVPVVDPSIKI